MAIFDGKPLQISKILPDPKQLARIGGFGGGV
jgi:hypothetical protein